MTREAPGPLWFGEWILWTNISYFTIEQLSPPKRSDHPATRDLAAVSSSWPKLSHCHVWHDSRSVKSCVSSCSSYWKITQCVPTTGAKTEGIFAPYQATSSSSKRWYKATESTLSRCFVPEITDATVQLSRLIRRANVFHPSAAQHNGATSGQTSPGLPFQETRETVPLENPSGSQPGATDYFTFQGHLNWLRIRLQQTTFTT